MVDGHIMHVNLATPQPEPQQRDDQIPAQLEGPQAGEGSMRGDMHMSDGAGGDSLQLRQAN